VNQDWSEFYPDAEEEMPPGMLTPKGKHVCMTMYVNTDHAHNLLTRQSVTGIVLFINNTLVKWVSKCQKTVKTSMYESELVAARVAVEVAIEYRYMLRMIGVPIDGPPVLMLGNNQSVVLNTIVPSSILKKKHNSLAYH
jgi:hypothetical protein